ncbi:hypothetical protein V6N11_069304 [Hibiscus sabdariffa]|uniref:RNase H type-1 domain-containing protein n=1 Tax=Hibiscus sabdariffa TaxID=183260 RepID=A0ABR1ZYU9_9ROSI
MLYFGLWQSSLLFVPLLLIAWVGMYYVASRVSSAASKSGGNNVHVEVHWCAPATSWCKVNTDGSRCNTTGRATCGGVLRNEKGLNYAWHLGYRKHEVELDSLSAVRILHGKVGAEAHSNLLSHIFEALRQD